MPTFKSLSIDQLQDDIRIREENQVDVETEIKAFNAKLDEQVELKEKAQSFS